MNFLPNPRETQLNSYGTETNDVVTITLAATEGVFHVIDQLAWSYSAAPTGGEVTVTIDSVVVFSLDITAAGPGRIDFPGGLYVGPAGKVAVITLAAGGSSIVGKLNVQRR